MPRFLTVSAFILLLALCVGSARAQGTWALRGSEAADPSLAPPFRDQAGAASDGFALPGVPRAPYESDILAARPTRWYIGPLLGGYAYQHTGSFSPNCDCELGGEQGLRVLGGLQVQLVYPKRGLAFGVRALYQDFSEVFTNQFTRTGVVVGPGTDVRDVSYERSSDVRLSYITLTPNASWYPWGNAVFFEAGIEAGLALEAEYDLTERILTPGLVYYDGGTETTLQPRQDIPGTNPRLGAVFGLGCDITLSRSILLTPQAGAVFPLLPVASSAPDWRVFSEFAFLVLKIRL